MSEKKSVCFFTSDLMAGFAWGMHQMGIHVMREHWYRMYERSVALLAMEKGYDIRCYYNCDDSFVLVNESGIMRWADGYTMDDVHRKLAAMPVKHMMILIAPFLKYTENEI